MKSLNKETNLLVEHDVCRNGCFLYHADASNVTCCPNTGCKKPRYANEGLSVAAQHMSIVSVGAFLADKLCDPQQVTNFGYRHKYDTIYHEQGVYKDIFSSSNYRELYRKDLGLFQGENDIGLMIVVDGFQPRHKSDTTMTVINCCILNLSPLER